MLQQSIAILRLLVCQNATERESNANAIKYGLRTSIQANEIAVVAPRIPSKIGPVQHRLTKIAEPIAHNVDFISRAASFCQLHPWHPEWDKHHWDPSHKYSHLCEQGLYL